jgi:isocitrate lyase
MRHDYSFTSHNARTLRSLLASKDGVSALGISTPAQAVQMVDGGLKAGYVSGWQVAADVNGDMYPDQSLYPADRCPRLVEGIINALVRQEQITSINGELRPYVIPLVADCEAGFGGALNAFELTKWMIKAGAAGVHFEDQLSSEKKCGHLGGKVLVPVEEFIEKLKAARLMADICDVPLVIIGRTDAEAAGLLTRCIPDGTDVRFIEYQEVDTHFSVAKQTDDGFIKIRGGFQWAIERALAFAQYVDVVWCETSNPSLEDAEKFANAIHERFPGKWLAYNMSPSFKEWTEMTPADLVEYDKRLNTLGYKFRFVTLAGFHSLNKDMFALAHDFANDGMLGYSRLQQNEKMLTSMGYRAYKHQGFVGTGYFDAVRQTLNPQTSLGALENSTEKSF